MTQDTPMAIGSYIAKGSLVKDNRIVEDNKKISRNRRVRWQQEIRGKGKSDGQRIINGTNIVRWQKDSQQAIRQFGCAVRKQQEKSKYAVGEWFKEKKDDEMKVRGKEKINRERMASSKSRTCKKS